MHLSFPAPDGARLLWRCNQVRLTTAIAQCSLPPASVPIPKFARFFGTLSCELRNQKDTTRYIILVRFLDLRFLRELPNKL